MLGGSISHHSLTLGQQTWSTMSAFQTIFEDHRRKLTPHFQISFKSWLDYADSEFIFFLFKNKCSGGLKFKLQKKHKTKKNIFLATVTFILTDKNVTPSLHYITNF